MHQLWYEQPAKDWNEALPLGNGRLGAMIFGGPEKEHLQLNEDSIWNGKPIDRINPSALPNLEKVRQLIFGGKIPEAEELLLKAFAGMPNTQRGYQTLGDMELTFKHIIGVHNYRRELSLDEAIHRVSFDTEDGIHYIRETYISAVDGCLVMRLTADKPGQIYVDLTMGRDRFFDEVWTEEGDTAAYQGNLGKGGIDFCVMARLKSIGGSQECIGEHVVVCAADEVIVTLTAATTYRYENIVEACRTILNNAETVSYDTLRERHCKEYHSYYGRLGFELEYKEELDELPTDQRLLHMSEEAPDLGLLATYLQFGRYLMIASSRPGSLPATLQGIWNKDMRAPWDSKYTININTEMNYWIAEVANLSECHLPLFELLEKVAVNGQQTANQMYDCKGFVAHHNTDIWGDSAPQDLWIPGSFWVMGGAWLCTHIWEHYEYTLDVEFLSRYYWIIKEAVRFFEDFLVEHNGYLVTCPSVSPENTYIMNDGTEGSVCAGATMDNEILYDLFDYYIKATDVLDEDHDYAEVAKRLQQQLPPVRVGKHGQIMEWLEDYEEKEPGHRHISQLYALYPSSQITVDETPDLARAAEKTLERRLANGGGHTGWSLSWIINFYARLWEGDQAMKCLVRLMKQSTLPNLFDHHPPFQIDGNFGSAAGMIEMLVQSNQGRVILLPALPKAWNSGKISGVCLRGGAELNMEWKDGYLYEAKIIAKHPFHRIVYYGDQEWEVELQEGEFYHIAYNEITILKE